MSLLHPLWTPPPTPESREGLAAAEQAVRLSAAGTRERGYADAIATFHGATVDVTLADNQHLLATMTADFGGGFGGPSGGLFVNLCYAEQGAEPVSDASYFGPLAAAQSTLVPFSVARSFTAGTDLLAGTTYTIGMCACVDGNDPGALNWNAGFSWADVRVFQQ